LISAVFVRFKMHHSYWDSSIVYNKELELSLNIGVLDY